MKYALISPMEPVETGYRIAEVRSSDFPVAKPLYWIECEDNITPDSHFYDHVSKAIKIKKPLAFFKVDTINGIQTQPFKNKFNSTILPTTLKLVSTCFLAKDYKWKINDALMDNFSIDPEFQFDSLGEYSIELFVSNESGEHSHIMTNVLTIIEPDSNVQLNAKETFVDNTSTEFTEIINSDGQINQ